MKKIEHFYSIIMEPVLSLISIYFQKLDSLWCSDHRHNQDNEKQAEFITRKANEMKQELNDHIDKRVEFFRRD